MKKIFILLSVLSLCLIAPVDAQTDMSHKRLPDKDNGEGNRVNIGFSFAPTINWMFPKTEDYERNGITMGFRCGIPLNINMTKAKHYYVLTGLFFEKTGGKLQFLDHLPTIPNITFDSVNTPRQCKYEVNYLTIPIGITLKTKSIHNFYICGNAGFYNSFRLKSYEHNSYTLNGEQWDREKKLSKESATFKESVFVGLGVEYSITKTFRAGIYINYSHSLTNYFKGKGLAKNKFSLKDQKANIGSLELTLNINFF